MGKLARGGEFSYNFKKRGDEVPLGRSFPCPNGRPVRECHGCENSWWVDIDDATVMVCNRCYENICLR